MLEQFESDLGSYVEYSTQIHRVIFKKLKGDTEDKGATISDQLQRICPGEWVYIQMFKRKWYQPRYEGPFKVMLRTPTALKVHYHENIFILACSHMLAKKKNSPQLDD